MTAHCDHVGGGLFAGPVRHVVKYADAGLCLPIKSITHSLTPSQSERMLRKSTIRNKHKDVLRLDACSKAVSDLAPSAVIRFANACGVMP